MHKDSELHVLGAFVSLVTMVCKCGSLCMKPFIQGPHGPIGCHVCIEKGLHSTEIHRGRDPPQSVKASRFNAHTVVDIDVICLLMRSDHLKIHTVNLASDCVINYLPQTAFFKFISPHHSGS